MTAHPAITYSTEVRSFDHRQLARHTSYAVLRRALSDLGNEVSEPAERMTLAAFLAAVRDMALTAPYGDMCVKCDDEHRAIWWPHAADRRENYIIGAYRCDQGHEWTCSYLIRVLGGT